MKQLSLLFICVLLLIQSDAQEKRNITPFDVYRFQQISDPQLSPDGNWVLYVLTSVDSAKDKYNQDLWMTGWDGKEEVQLTNGPDNESSPRFSPDGKYISFLASRVGDDEKVAEKKSQVYLMDRRGGEAKKLTNVKGNIIEYLWKPEGSGITAQTKDYLFYHC